MRRMRFVLIPAVLVAVLAAGLPPLPARAAAGDSAIPLPTTDFGGIAAANGYVFVAGTNAVLVRNPDGSAKTEIPLPTPADLDVSPDGTRLYVALGSSGGIAVIDTARLVQVAKYRTGRCTESVAATARVVWYGHGCGNFHGYIGAVDLRQDPVGVEPHAAGCCIAAPLLAWSSAVPGRLFAGGAGENPSPLYAYRIHGSTLTEAHTAAAGSNLRDMAITSDGADLVVAPGAPYYHPRFRTSDLSPDGRYATTNYPNAVASNPNGLLAAGVYSGVPTVWVYNGARQLVGSYDLGASGWLADAGLAYGAGALYAVTVNAYGENPVLNVLSYTAQPVPTLELAAPVAAPRARSLSVNGMLAVDGVPLPDETLHVRRSDLDGNHTLADVHTGADGVFAFTDTPTVGGPVTYRVTFAGDATHTATTKSILVNVSRHVPTLTMTTDRASYRFDGTALVSAHLGNTYTNRVLSIYARPYRQPQTLVATGPVNAHGNLAVRVQVSRATTFRAAFTGDERWAPTTARRSVVVHASVRTSVGRILGRDGAYRIYSAVRGGVLAVKVAPRKAGRTVTFLLQVYRRGSWHDAATGHRKLNRFSAARVGFWGNPGHRYRVRGAYPGDPANLATAGRWQYAKFR